MATSTYQQLREARRLARSYPLFTEQLAPKLPELEQHVATHGHKDMAPAPLFAVGDHVRVQHQLWKEEYHTGIVNRRVPGWLYGGRFSRWFYYLTYDEGQVKPGLGFIHALPAWEERLTRIAPLANTLPVVTL